MMDSMRVGCAAISRDTELERTAEDRFAVTVAEGYDAVIGIGETLAPRLLRQA